MSCDCAKQRRVEETPASLVGFGGYRCDCTIVCADIVEVPDVCPTHNVGLLGPRSWERNHANVPLGLTDGKVTRQLVKEIRS